MILKGYQIKRALISKALHNHFNAILFFIENQKVKMTSFYGAVIDKMCVFQKGCFCHCYMKKEMVI
jgi:hypothetical protein